MKLIVRLVEVAQNRDWYSFQSFCLILWPKSVVGRGRGYQPVTENVHCFRNTTALSWFFHRDFEKFWMGFRVESLAGRSYGSVIRVVPKACKIHEKILQNDLKVPSHMESEHSNKFLHQNLVRTIRKPCQALNTKALSRGEYESSVQFLDTRALSKVDYESLVKC